MKNRQQKISKLGHSLLRTGVPRVEMAVLVVITGLVGFTASIMLLHAGVTSMGVRYPVAVAGAYLAFLLLLWAWLRLRGELDADLLELVPDLPLASRSAPLKPSPAFEGKGGTFDGGGASADYEGGDGESLLGESVSAAADADEAAVPLLAVVAVAALFSSLFYLVFSLVSAAPFLFAELLLDGAISATLYRKLKGIERRHWAQTAVRRTIVPFALTAAMLSGAGFLMAWFAPGAQSLGAFLSASSNSSI